MIIQSEKLIKDIEEGVPEKTKALIQQAILLIGSVLAVPYNQAAREVFLNVEENIAQLVFKKIGFSVYGYKHLIDRGEINKIMRDHSQEPRKGQLSITEQDFLLIPYVVSMPDEISKGEKTKRTHLNALRFEKRVNGWLFVVEEIRTGKGQLAVKSLYKYPAVPGADHVDEDLSSTPEAHSSIPPVSNIIPDVTEKSNNI